MSEPTPADRDRPVRPPDRAPYQAMPYGVYGPGTNDPRRPDGPPAGAQPYSPMPIRPTGLDRPSSALATVGKVISAIGLIGFLGIIAFSLLGSSLTSTDGVNSFVHMAALFPWAIGCWILAFIGVVLSGIGRRR